MMGLPRLLPNGLATVALLAGSVFAVPTVARSAAARNQQGQGNVGNNQQGQGNMGNAGINPGMLAAIDQLLELYIQAQQMGLQVPGLQNALNALVGDLTNGMQNQGGQQGFGAGMNQGFGGGMNGQGGGHMGMGGGLNGQGGGMCGNQNGQGAFGQVGNQAGDTPGQHRRHGQQWNAGNVGGQGGNGFGTGGMGRKHGGWMLASLVNDLSTALNIINDLEQGHSRNKAGQLGQQAGGKGKHRGESGTQTAANTTVGNQADNRKWHRTTQVASNTNSTETHHQHNKQQTTTSTTTTTQKTPAAKTPTTTVAAAAKTPTTTVASAAKTAAVKPGTQAFKPAQHSVTPRPTVAPLAMHSIHPSTIQLGGTGTRSAVHLGTIGRRR